MDFEQALLISLTSGEGQQLAHNFLLECSENPNYFKQAVNVFFSTQNESIRFYVSCLITRYIDTLWSSIDPQDCISFRAQLIPYYFFLSENNDQLMKKTLPALSSQIEIIIASIAFNEWPENWPTFVDDLLMIINQKNIDITNSLSKVFNILKNVVSQFSTSRYITLTRRNLLVQELQYKISEIILILQSIPFEKVTSSGVGYSFLNFIQLFCNLNLDDQSICLNLANFLFVNFAPSFPATFKSLENLIVRPRVDLALFNISLQNILQLIQKPFNDTQPIIEFICRLINASISVFPNCSADTNFFSAIRVILEYTLTNTTKIDYVAEFWKVWASLLHNFIDGINLRTSASYLILEPMIPSILASLFEYLPAVLGQSRLIAFPPLSAITAFTMIDEQLLLSFLAQKPLSSALCISLGMVQFLDGNDLFDNILTNVIPQVLSNYGADLNSSLFLLSRNVEFLRKKPEILKIFLDNIITSLLISEDPSIKQMALFALNHIASKIPTSIVQTCPEFVVYMLENFIDPNKFEHDDFLRACRIMSKIVSSASDQNDRKKYAEILTTPIAHLLNDSCELKAVELGCEAATALAYISFESTETMTNLWAPLSLAMAKTERTDIFSIVCECFATTIRTCSWNRCLEVVSNFLSFTTNVQNQEPAIVHALAQIRLCHREMDNFRQLILETHISKISQQFQQSTQIAVEFFEFFDAFDIFENEMSFILPMACQGIRCQNLAISKSATNLLIKHHMNVFCENEIIQAVFDALFDQLHHKCLKKLLKLLYCILIKMHKKHAPYEQCIFAAIKDKVCDDELSTKIVISLKNSLTSDTMFTELIGDFLVAMGRANPGEIQMLSDKVSTRSRTVTSVRTYLFTNEDEIANS